MPGYYTEQWTGCNGCNGNLNNGPRTAYVNYGCNACPCQNTCTDQGQTLNVIDVRQSMGEDVSSVAATAGDCSTCESIYNQVPTIVGDAIGFVDGDTVIDEVDIEQPAEDDGMTGYYDEVYDTSMCQGEDPYSYEEWAPGHEGFDTGLGRWRNENGQFISEPSEPGNECGC